MKLKHLSDNGNIATINRSHLPSHLNYDNSSWLSHSANIQDVLNNIETNNSQVISNCNTYNSRESSHVESTDTTSEDFTYHDTSVNIVCNRQYRINSRHHINLNVCNNKQTNNLEQTSDTTFSPGETFLADTNAACDTPALDEERAFEQSDTDEMSENSTHPVPRGIVNPNYPGFQHLAHTLQDYSTNIENFYHSENEMTDDDIDVEITDSTYEPELNQNEKIVGYEKYVDNNNGNNELKEKISLTSQKESCTRDNILDSFRLNDVPDLIKTIPQNNNNESTIEYDLNCSDTDIENNFNAKDIIGDFNKEIEDEIKQLLNYNINIQDDLEELRKDIKDSFAKPIENTINNISDVVNHVIKKLVETKVDTYDKCENNKTITIDSHINACITEVDASKDNETNSRTEMNLSRPTFLLLENNVNHKIADAFLSDGKDEIHVYENEYDTDALSTNVERTIQQLSTELRKIIPKLDEMREKDKLWTEPKKKLTVTDGNSNEIASSSKYHHVTLSMNSEHKLELSRNQRKVNESGTIKKTPNTVRIEPKVSRDRAKDITKNYFHNAQSNVSVRKNEVAREYELGSFDVYNIETALPKLDFDAIENHLKAAKEAERRKRNDREEIRRRLAMGAEAEEYHSMGHTDRPGRKPSLHSRLQNGMNLQICFMNETASDSESQASDLDKNTNCNNKNMSRSSIFSKSNFNHPYQTRPLSVNITKNDKISSVQSVAKLRPTTLSTKTPKSRSSHSLGHIELKESDFYALQATLQTEARIALAQAKEMARVQMERERRSRAVSPVTEMLRRSMEKANAPLAADRRRVSRQLLTDMNIAQLQVIVNELHSQIESLNDSLVKMLMARDELHMGQDSMLVDIEDLTRYLGVKEQTKKTKGTSKAPVRRFTIVHK